MLAENRIVNTKSGALDPDQFSGRMSRGEDWLDYHQSGLWRNPPNPNP